MLSSIGRHGHATSAHSCTRETAWHGMFVHGIFEGESLTYLQPVLSRVACDSQEMAAHHYSSYGAKHQALR